MGKGRVKERRRFFARRLQRLQVIETHGGVENRFALQGTEPVAVVPFLHACDDVVNGFAAGVQIQHLRNHRAELILTEAAEPGKHRMRREVVGDGKAGGHGIQGNRRYPRDENAGNGAGVIGFRFKPRVEIFQETVGGRDTAKKRSILGEKGVCKLIVLVNDDIEFLTVVVPEYGKKRIQQIRRTAEIGGQYFLLAVMRVGVEKTGQAVANGVVETTRYIVAVDPGKNETKNIKLIGKRCLMVADIGVVEILFKISRFVNVVISP